MGKSSQIVLFDTKYILSYHQESFYRFQRGVNVFWFIGPTTEDEEIRIYVEANDIFEPD